MARKWETGATWEDVENTMVPWCGIILRQLFYSQELMYMFMWNRRIRIEASRRILSVNEMMLAAMVSRDMTKEKEQVKIRIEFMNSWESK